MSEGCISTDPTGVNKNENPNLLQTQFVPTMRVNGFPRQSLIPLLFVMRILFACGLFAYVALEVLIAIATSATLNLADGDTFECTVHSLLEKNSIANNPTICVCE